MSRNVRLLELYNICLSALFIMPVMIPYYRDQIGLSFQDFLIGEAIFAGVVVALEVPSGWLSDVWKRKHVLTLSCVFWMAGFGFMLAADDFTMAVISQVVIGVAVSLFSGTSSALLYDTLLAEGRESAYSRLEGRRFGVGLYSIALASIAGGFMYDVHPDLPLIATIAITVPAVIACLMIVEPPRYKSAVQGHPLKDMAVTIRYAIHGHAEVGFIIIFAGLLFGGTKMIMWSQQPYYMALQLPEYYYGLLMAVGFMLSGLSGQLAHRLDGHVSNLRALTIALLVAFGICVLAGGAIGYHGVGLLMIGGSFLYGMAAPRVSNAINQRVESDRRATILSVVNLLRELCFIPLSLLAGYAVTRGGIGQGLHVIAGWMMLAGLFIGLWAIRRRRVRILAQS